MAEAAAFSYAPATPVIDIAVGVLLVRKPRFVVFVLAAGLIVMIAASSLLNAGPRRPGSGGSRADQLAPVLADAKSALPGPAGHAGQAADRTATDAAQTEAQWWKVRPMLAAEVAAVRRARAAHRRPRPVTVRLCRRFQHVAAFGAHGAGLVVRNDNYGGRRECLANKNRWANFAVASSEARRAGSEPAAFPTSSTDAPGASAHRAPACRAD
jgi:hypothetical protein